MFSASRLRYLRSQRWTPLEVTIWVSAVVVVIILGALWAIEVVGSWVLLIGSAIVMALGLMRYRAETEQKKRNADNQGGPPDKAH